MIALFEKDATDFAANGLGILEPAKCEVYEALNGAYELTLSHPYDERGKWRRLTTQRIVRARVPAAPTPAVSAPEAPGQALSVYRVDTPSGRRLHLRAKPSTAAKILESYKPGAEVTRLADVGDWLRVSVPSGASGYMWKDYLSHVRDEAGDPSGQAAGLPSRPARDQPFRIYKIEPGESEVKVYARHIFFDLSDNLALSVAADEATGAQALKMILESAQAAHEFTGYSDLTEHAASAQWALKSISECLLGAGGLIETWGGELFRDWYDVYAVKRLGAARGVTIRRGKNLTKLAGYLDDTGLTTRILPVGQDERGKMLYLPELYVDSPHLLEYPHPKLCALRVADAKVGGKVTKEKAYARMRRAAQAQFDLGVDRTRASLDAAFVDLSATDLYQGTELADLQSVFLGDSVTLIDEATGMNASLRVCEYTYDALAGRYESISLGAALKGSECQMISPRQIPAGAIGGTMISPGAVDGGALKDGAVDTLHIRDAAITNALIANAAIGTAQIADAAITNAKIDRLAVADANIQDATITAAKIASATITSAQIADAAIGTAQIALGAITTALIEPGAVGTAQIANASITDGKIVELTANKINAGTLSVERLIIAGNTKSIVFAINEFNDTPHLSYNTIDGGALTRRSITADRIVAGAITADEIAASTILAGNIAAGAITGAKIASDTITARCLAAGAVTTDKVSANFGAALDLSSNRTVRITSGVQSGSAGGKTVVSVTPQDGLRVNQSALGTYFQAGALGFGLYREDGTPLAEAGLDGNESYFAVRELRDATLDGAL